ncbi:hypothetical protein MM236_08970 [Belliella sp. DSM 107340]|uniref:Uncharacterized protein n=1 Tax=Belliella calami TaxID=2923436 RepID=A0ABS9UND7_9BACT|nr:hypothetical protein [Belliella calami]MCH7398118.1 hypothetical protein [Belliella calami]
MDIIKRHYVKRSYRKHNFTKNEKLSFPEKISSIGILASTQVEFVTCKDKLESVFGESVEISGFYDSSRDMEHGISSRDFNLWGKPNARIERFLEKKTDFILVPTLNLNPYLLYLLLHSKTAIKIGFHSSENRKYLDLMLDYKDNNLKESIQDLLDYYIKIKEAC